MKKIDIPLLLFIAVTIAAAVVRGLSLSIVFDKDTGLAQPFHYLTWILAGLTALAALYSLTLSFNKLSAGGGKNEIMLLVAAVILGASGFLDIIDIVRGIATLTQVALAGLGILSAVCVLLLVRSRNAEKYTMGMFATIPVFLGGFWFVTLFVKNGSNPVLLSYIYDFMAVLFFSICASTFAGFYFGQIKKRMLTFTWGIGLFFLSVSLFAPYIAMIYNYEGSMLDLSGTAAGSAAQLRLLFAVLYMLTIPSMAKKAMEMPNPPEEESENAENPAV